MINNKVNNQNVTFSPSLRVEECNLKYVLYWVFHWLSVSTIKCNFVFTERMEPLCSLAKGAEINVNLCLFCQKRKAGKDDLIVPGELGLNKARESLQCRKQVGEVGDVINRLDEVFSGNCTTRNIKSGTSNAANVTDILPKKRELSKSQKG